MDVAYPPFADKHVDRSTSSHSLSSTPATRKEHSLTNPLPSRKTLAVNLRQKMTRYFSEARTLCYREHSTA